MTLIKPKETMTQFEPLEAQDDPDGAWRALRDPD